MSALYPLVFKTIFKDKIWGGNKIKTVLGKEFSPLPNCGETWEISGVEGDISEVVNGPFHGQNLKSLVQEFKSELVGEKVYEQFGDEFPLLIKFIDANQDLSIQVHPNDELARSRHNSFGKTEMWYAVQADPGASLISGFNQEVDQETYVEHFKKGKLTDILNQEEVNDGDVFFLPAGRVHTIGKGLLIAEIQQTSDITYRIYDFDRVDAQGNKRELHVEEALDAIDYGYYDDYKTQYSDKKDSRVQLVKSPYFTTNKLNLTKPFEVSLTSLDSFKIYMVLDGEVTLRALGNNSSLKKGQVVLIPACIKQYTLETSTDTTLLESYIE
ncbi:MAG: class I mannose-6-phosphate isomerase [Cyclobacteriaceae bacterium]|nr:class I mannose-6-phosphate isomerase [Cyclobacteriaceae bacterium HetDA_MAG_MS6]